ncbi:hypothetical protein EJB05_51020, partial [Eragrostis curvula]
MAGMELDEELEKRSSATADTVEMVAGVAGQQEFIDRLIQDVDKDHLRLLQKIRDRMNRVDVQEPTIDVRFRDLTVEAECRVVNGKPLPTLWNSALSAASVSNSTPTNCSVSLFGYLSKSAFLRRTLYCFTLTPMCCTHMQADPSARASRVWQDYPFACTCRETHQKPRGFQHQLLAGSYFLRTETLDLVMTRHYSILALQVTGDIEYNGLKLNEFVAQKTAAYVSQTDLHVPEMTVRETLNFSARFQGVGWRGEILREVMRREEEAGIIPDPDVDMFMKAISMEGPERNIHTDYIMKIMGLEKCADTMVGDAMRRGISGGEKKRLTIGSVSCFSLVSRTVLCLSQTDLVLSRKDQKQFWSLEDGRYNFVTVDQFCQRFRGFHVGQSLSQKLSEIYERSKVNNSAISFSIYSLSKWEVLKFCFSRELLLMKRNAFLYRSKVIQVGLVAVLTGTVFLRTRMFNDRAHANYYIHSLFFAIVFLIVNGLPEISMTISRLPVFYKQRDCCFYPAWAYAIPAFFLKIPVSLIESIVWTSITYCLIGYIPEASRCDGESMPNWLQWVFWISPMSYGEISLTGNEFLTPRWQKVMVSGVTLGKAILTGQGLDYSSSFYWVSVGALLVFIVVLNIGFAIGLTIKRPPGTTQALVSRDKLTITQGKDQDSFEDMVDRAPRLPKAIPNTPNVTGKVLPFKPLAISFRDVNYYIDTPAVLISDNEAIVKQLSIPPPGMADLHFRTQFPQKFGEQFKACLWKQCLSHWRTPSYNLARIVYVALSSILFGVMYWQKGNIDCINDQQGFFSILGSMYLTILYIGIINSKAVMPFVSVERSVMYRERFAGMYSPWAYSFAQLAMEIPYVGVQVLLFMFVAYPMIGYAWTVTKLLWFFYTLFCTVLYFIYLGMMIVSLTSNSQMATIISSMCFIVQNLMAGFIVHGPQIPVWWIWLYRITPTSWMLNLFFTSQFLCDDDKNIMVSGEIKTVTSYAKDYLGYHRDLLPVAALMLAVLPVLFGVLFAYNISKFNFQRR